MAQKMATKHSKLTLPSRQHPMICQDASNKARSHPYCWVDERTSAEILTPAKIKTVRRVGEERDDWPGVLSGLNSP